jgi:hypothetical protein
MVGVSSATARWGSSGLACLTGLPDGPPDFSRANVLARADSVAAAAGHRMDIAVDAVGLLTGRAGLLGLTRGGRVSAGGATRLLAALDGWCAITPVTRRPGVGLMREITPAGTWNASPRRSTTTKCFQAHRAGSARAANFRKGCPRQDFITIASLLTGL